MSGAGINAEGAALAGQQVVVIGGELAHAVLCLMTTISIAGVVRENVVNGDYAMT